MDISIIKRMYKNKLVKSGIWYTVGTLFIQGLSFITVPIFVRLLKESDFGIVSVYGNYLSIFTTVISLSLVSSVQNAKFDFKEDYDGFLSSIFFLGTVSVSLWLVLGIIFKESLAQILGLSSNLIILLIVQSFFGFTMDCSNRKFTVEYEYKKYLFVSISSAVFNIILSIIMIKSFTQNKYYGRIQAGAIVTCIYGAILYVITMVKGKKLICKKYWKYALVISLPLIFHTLSGVILTSMDSIMIKKFLGNAEAGIYSFAYKIGMILQIVWMATNKAWVPWFFENMTKKNYSEIQKKVKYYIGLFSLITFILIYISPEIGKIMGTKGYLKGLGFVPLIMLGYYFVFLYSIPSNIEFYLKKTQYTSLGTFMAALVNIVLNYILIPKYGVKAAAWTTVISYILLFLYHYIISLRITKVRIFKFKYFLYCILFMCGVSIVFYIVKDILIIRYICVTLVLIFLGYKLKRSLKEI